MSSVRSVRERGRRPSDSPTQPITLVDAPPDRDRTSVPLAVCAHFKNEGRYLREWIDFHRLVGVERFFLYDNRSEDDFLPILRPFIEQGIVVLHRMPPEPHAMDSYNHCLAQYQDEARWIAFIDLDEFLYAREEDDLREVLRDFEDHPAVAVHWIMFATSGHILAPDGLVTETYTRCQAEGNRHHRLVVDPKRALSMRTTHKVILPEGEVPVNERFEPVPELYTQTPTVERLRLNHYWTKSVEEFFFVKVARGNPENISALRDAEGLIDAERNYSGGEDLAIQRFVPQLRDGVESPV